MKPIRLNSVQSIVILFLSLVVMLSCTLPGTGGSPAQPTTNLMDTQVALNIQSTLLAGQQATLDASKSQPTQLPQAQPTYTQIVLPPTYTPYPTYTSVATEPPPAATQAPQPEATQDVDALIRKANVLVFEDIQGYPALDTRVHQAVTAMGFSGGRVVEVGDAVGNFMEQLNSAVRWDLIIVAAEAREGVRGEFWDIITEHVNRGTALIVEIWYLDEIANGRIAPLLGKCGVAFQDNWGRSPGYNALDYSIYWLDQYNEVFSTPNVVGPLYTPNIYWMKDAGDIIRLGSGGDAVLLAGKYPNKKSSHGVLASCLQGRMIIQTYSTHDYRRDHTVPLWQNFITYTLKNHFLTAPK